MASSQGSQASIDLGLGGGEGDALTQQMTDEEKRRRKKLAMSGQADPNAANAMGQAAISLLGSFRG